MNFNNSEDDSTSKAKIALEKIYSTISRTYLLLRIRRDFFLGMAELLRLRYTAATAYYRLQSESFALIKLFGNKPQIAQDWMNATTNTLGHDFFKKYQKQIRDIIKESNLYEDYKTASGLSMHSRILGVASGLIIGNKMRKYGKSNNAIFVYHDIDDHVSLFIWFTNYLKFHEKLSYNLFENIQEFEETDLNKINIKKYSELIIVLSNRLIKLKNSNKSDRP